jgi:dihydrofolate reductase
MRKIVLGLGISLDMYIARPDGSVDFLFMPKDFSMSEFFASIDTGIMGRKTYEAGMRMSGGKLPSMGGPMYVFSHTETPGERNGVVFTNQPPKSFVDSLREQNGKNIWLMGGGELARDFLKENLVDEIHLGLVPVLLGEGLPLFPPGFPQRDLALIESKTYGEGLISLKYAVTPAAIADYQQRPTAVTHAKPTPPQPKPTTASPKQKSAPTSPKSKPAKPHKSKPKPKSKRK